MSAAHDATTGPATEYQVRLSGSGRDVAQVADYDQAETIADDYRSRGFRPYVVWVEQAENGRWYAQED